MAGSIKWLENKPFDSRDHARLIVHRSQLPGADDQTALLAVARSGCTVEGLAVLGPGDLLQCMALHAARARRGSPCQARAALANGSLLSVG